MSKSSSKLARFFKGIPAGIKNFGSNTSNIINSVLLLIVYVAFLGTTSIIARISGKKFLNKIISKKKKTYWSDLNLKKKSMKTYYRQF